MSNVGDIKKAMMQVGSKVDKLECKCLGQDVVMHSMSTTQHEVYMEYCTKNPTMKQAKLVQICMHDKNGQQIWSAGEVGVLGSYRIDQDAVNAALTVNGWGDPGQDAIVKNSQETSGDDGVSGQPENTKSQ